MAQCSYTRPQHTRRSGRSAAAAPGDGTSPSPWRIVNAHAPYTHAPARAPAAAAPGGGTAAAPRHCCSRPGGRGAERGRLKIRELDREARGVSGVEPVEAWGCGGMVRGGKGPTAAGWGGGRAGGKGKTRPAPTRQGIPWLEEWPDPHLSALLAHDAHTHVCGLRERGTGRGKDVSGGSC